MTQDAAAESIKNMLTELADGGVTISYIERVLRLEAGTLAKWVAGIRDPEDIALLRIIRAYPWLLWVVDNNFTNSDVNLLLGLADLVEDMAKTKGQKAEETKSGSNEDENLCK